MADENVIPDIPYKSFRLELPLRIMGADDLYLAQNGKLKPVANALRNANDHPLTQLKLAPVIFRPSDADDIKKIISKLKAAREGTDEFTRYASVNIPSGTDFQLLRRNQLDAIAPFINDPKKVVEALNALKTAHATAGIAEVPDIYLETIEHTLRNNAAILPDPLLAAISQQKINIVVAQDLKPLLTDEQKALLPEGAHFAHFVDYKPSLWAGVSLAHAMSPDHPSTLGEFVIDVAYILDLEANKNKAQWQTTVDGQKLTPDECLSIMRQEFATEEAQRFVRTEKYDGTHNRDTRNIKEIEVLKTMHYWLNDRRSGIAPDEVRRAMPECAHMYKKYINAILYEQTRKLTDQVTQTMPHKFREIRTWEQPGTISPAKPPAGAISIHEPAWNTEHPANISSTFSQPDHAALKNDIPYYTIEESQAPQQPIKLNKLSPTIAVGNAFITPSAVHEAKRTGIYQITPFHKVVKKADDTRCADLRLSPGAWQRRTGRPKLGRKPKNSSAQNIRMADRGAGN